MNKLKYVRYFKKEPFIEIKILEGLIPEKKSHVTVEHIHLLRIDEFDFEKYSEENRAEEFHKWLDMYLSQRQQYWGSLSKREVAALLRKMPESEPDFGMWELPKKYQNDRDICKIYLKKRNLQFVSSKWLNDFDMMLWYVAQHKDDTWKCYDMISDKLLNNASFISQAMEYDPTIFQFAGKNVQKDKFLIMQFKLAKNLCF